MVYMSKSVKAIVSVVVVMSIVVTTIGISYSYFTDNLSSDENYLNTINSNNGKLEVAYSAGNTIEISNVNPGSDYVHAKTFSVKGTNMNSNNLNYILSLVIDENTYNNDDISYSLVGYNPLSNGEIIPNVSNSILNGKNTIVLGKGYFNNADAVVHTYDIKFYLNKVNNKGVLKAHFEVVEG